MNGFTHALLFSHILNFCLCYSYRMSSNIVRISYRNSYFLMSHSDLPYSDASLINELVKSGVGTEKLKFRNNFQVLAQNSYFIEHIWQKRPFLCEKPIENIIGSFTMNNVKSQVDTNFLEAGRGTFVEGKGGWNMAAVSQPRGKTFEDAKLRFEDVQMAMKTKSGTVVFNSAGGFVPPLAEVCLQCIQAFDVPMAINMYLTAAGQAVSAPPHTDKQDVIVLQTQGQKRWRVYQPPPPKRMIRADPFARGKGNDELNFNELEEPLLDIVLSPGQLLYVPSGFPHTTDTATRVTTEDPSVHLTIGLDTHIWGLTYSTLRKALLRNRQQVDGLVETKLNDEAYWGLQNCLPFGFLQHQHQGQLAVELAKRLLAAEPTKWYFLDLAALEKASASFDATNDPLSPAAAAAPAAMDKETALFLAQVTEESRKLAEHHRKVTDIFRKLYADVAFKITPVQMDLSFFRSKPYFVALEDAMESFLKSVTPPTKATSKK